MKTLALYNIKGGVGKTASAVNLAWQMARNGRRVLLWDLDPQGAASFYLRVKPRIKGSTRKLIAGKLDLDELIHSTEHDRLDLLPADFSYRHMDLHLDDASKSKKRLAGLLKPLRHGYDLVVIDCPPSISLVSENIFRVADLILVPLIPTTLSLRTWQQIRQHFDDQSIDPARLVPFISMADRRKRLHRETMQQLASEEPTLLRTVIPYAADVERMGQERAPLGTFAAHSPAGIASRLLADAVAARLG